MKSETPTSTASTQFPPLTGPFLSPSHKASAEATRAALLKQPFVSNEEAYAEYHRRNGKIKKPSALLKPGT